MKNLLLLIGMLSLIGIVAFEDETENAFQHERVSIISIGESVELQDHLGEGYTIIEFGAEW